MSARKKVSNASKYTAIVGAAAVAAGSMMAPFSAQALTERSSTFTPIINAESDDVLHNPDRGGTRTLNATNIDDAITEITSGNYKSSSYYGTYAYPDISIVELYLNFMSYAEAGLPDGKVISDANLAKLTTFFEAVRNEGIKVNFVFKYSDSTAFPSTSAANLPAYIDAVEVATDQILEIIDQNKDVVTLIQDNCGNRSYYGGYRMSDMFRGAYNNTSKYTTETGYYYGAVGGCYYMNNTQRAGLFNHIVANAPSGVYVNASDQILARYLSSTYTDMNVAFGLSNYARDNYYWGASDSDQDTIFSGLVDWYAYNSKTHFVGGDFIFKYSDTTGFDNLLSSGLELSYVNYINPTSSATTYTEAMNKSGYRLHVTDADIEIDNDEVKVDIDLENTGYGRVLFEKDASIIFSDGTNTYESRGNIDIRDMVDASRNYDLVFTAEYPTGMPAGTYDVYLRISDPYDTIREDAKYSMKLANVDTFDDTIVGNKIGSIVVDVTDIPDPTPAPTPTPTPTPDPVPDVPEVPDTGLFTKSGDASKIAGFSLISFGATLLGATFIYNLCRRRAHRHIINR